MGTLRTILALSVVFAHTSHPFVFVGGRTAVQLFYMISGFLISYVLTNTQSYNNVGVFWANRALRLYPVYYFVALLTLAGYFLYPSRMGEFGQAPLLAKCILAIVNVTIVGQDWVMFLSDHNGVLEFTGRFWESDVQLWHLLLVPQAWTLGIELSFYAVAPFIIRRPILLLLLFVLSIAGRAFAIYDGFGLEDPWTYRFFPFELALFILGIASHQLLLKPAMALIAKLPQFPVDPFVYAGCAIACTVYFLVPLSEWVKLPALIAIIFLSLPFLFLFQDKNAADKWIGDLSYPLYIGHLFAMLIVAHFIGKYEYLSSLPLAIDLIKVFFCLIFAVILKIVIADPVESIRRAVRNARKPPPETGLKGSQRNIQC